MPTIQEEKLSEWLTTVNVWNFSFAPVSRIMFGPGRISDLGREASLLGSYALLVAGRSFVRQSGLLNRLESLLRSRSVRTCVFDEVSPEPTLPTVEKAVARFRDEECNLVIAVGGGSAIDVGKTVAALAPAPGTVSEYFYGRPISRKGCPFIAVPTTAGSGAEVTMNAVLTDPERGLKASIRSPYMVADIALIDPELTLSLPKTTTAYSGMDALSQAVESYVSLGASPLTDILAEDATIRLMRALPRVYDDGSNIDLRTEVALGSLMSGIALANARLGLVHGLAHPLGALTGLPHGLVCALLLPSVVRFNSSAAATKYAQLARQAEIVGADVPDEEAAVLLAAEFDRMNEYMGISEQRANLRVGTEHWPSVISQTLASGSAKSNPRPVTPEVVEQILTTL